MEKFLTVILLDLSSGIYIFISEGKFIMKKKLKFLNLKMKFNTQDLFNKKFQFIDNMFLIIGLIFRN